MQRKTVIFSIFLTRVFQTYILNKSYAKGECFAPKHSLNSESVCIIWESVRVKTRERSLI